MDNITHTGNENDLQNMRVNGFRISTLNSMEYKTDTNDDSSGLESNSIPCNYILPKNLKLLSNSISILSFNIRSMKQNFSNFKAELLYSKQSFDVIGFARHA